MHGRTWHTGKHSYVFGSDAPNRIVDYRALADLPQNPFFFDMTNGPADILPSCALCRSRLPEQANAVYVTDPDQRCHVNLVAWIADKNRVRDFLDSSDLCVGRSSSVRRQAQPMAVVIVAGVRPGDPKQCRGTGERD
jgi:hypothetical protein